MSLRGVPGGYHLAEHPTAKKTPPPRRCSTPAGLPQRVLRQQNQALLSRSIGIGSWHGVGWTESYTSTRAASLEVWAQPSSCTFQQRTHWETRDSQWFTTQGFPEMCSLLYSSCHIFVHRRILNSWSSCSDATCVCLKYFYNTKEILLKFSFRKLHGPVTHVTDTFVSAA